MLRYPMSFGLVKKMKVLLDTHAFIWSADSPHLLSSDAQSAIANLSNEIYLSSVSAWEIQIKVQIGKLRLTYPLKDTIENWQRTNNLHILDVQLSHIYALDALPFHHKDPFDRLLIAQAQAEVMSIVSEDNVFANYGVNPIW